MPILPILTEPDPRLRKVSTPVTEVTSEIKRLLNDMVETMHDAEGVGLAAPQVNVQRRIIVVECPLNQEEKSRTLYKMINPVITYKSDELSSHEEACLSVPNEQVLVERFSAIKLNYMDENGKDQTLEATEFLAICVQHEIDHLDGKLIVDSLSKLKKQVALKRLRKLKKHEEE